MILQYRYIQIVHTCTQFFRTRNNHLDQTATGVELAVDVVVAMVLALTMLCQQVLAGGIPWVVVGMIVANWSVLLTRYTTIISHHVIN